MRAVSHLSHFLAIVLHLLFECKKLNTVYYKHELLNSVSSAIEHGINPKDIFVFDKSLPFNKSYSMFDLLNYQDKALQYFYMIGNPWSLVPNSKIMMLNTSLRLFYITNSFLFVNHIKPLYLNNLPKLIDFSNISYNDFVAGLSELVSKSMLKKRMNFSEYEKYIQKEIIFSKSQIDDCLFLENISIEELPGFLKKKTNKKYIRYCESFFRILHKNERPLVCVNLENSKVRVLGRSLVNKKEKNIYGLELKEIVRHSPLGSLMEGGAAIYKTINDEKRDKELHVLELRKKQLEIENLEKQGQIHDLEIVEKKIAIIKGLHEIASSSDVTSVNRIPVGYIKQKLIDAYKSEDGSRTQLLDSQGLALDYDSIKIIDLKV